MSTQNVIDRPTAKTTSACDQGRCNAGYRPNVDIIERPDELIVRADVPGLTAKDIDIDFENGTLTFRGRVADRQAAETKYLHHEYGVGDYFRTFRIGETIDASRITAECSNGVLTLHLPKIEAVKPRKILVSATS